MLYHNRIQGSICFPMGKPDPFGSACVVVLLLAHSMGHIVPFDWSEEAEEALQYLGKKRAAIFNETKDGLLTLSKEDKAVFRYRQGRRTQWKAVAAETMLNE